MTYTDTETGEEIAGLPAWDENDPASLEAWFGNFGHAEHFRKITLANAREAERAKAVEREEKITEARLDDKARISDMYVSFIVSSLQGRILREKNVRESMAR